MIIYVHGSRSISLDLTGSTRSACSSGLCGSFLLCGTRHGLDNSFSAGEDTKGMAEEEGGWTTDHCMPPCLFAISDVLNIVEQADMRLIMAPFASSCHLESWTLVDHRVIVLEHSRTRRDRPAKLKSDHLICLH